MTAKLSKRSFLPVGTIHCCIPRLTDNGLIKLRFYIPPDTKQVILDTCFPANLLAKYWQTKTNTTKQTCIRNKIYYNIKLTQKTKARFGHLNGWLRGSVAERRSSAGVLSMSCARPVADGWPLMWVNRLLWINQPGQLSLSSLWGRQMSSKLQLDVSYLS